MSFLDNYSSAPSQFQAFHPFSAQEAIIDITDAHNSAQALKTIADIVNSAAFSQWVRNGGQQIDLNAGALFLTGKIISKINVLLKQYSTVLYTVYSTLPQTQQGALDAGFFVKEAPKYIAPVTVDESVAPRLTDTEEALSDLFGEARQQKQQLKVPPAISAEITASDPALNPTADPDFLAEILANQNRELSKLSLPFEFDPQSKVNQRWDDIPGLSSDAESLTFSRWQKDNEHLLNDIALKQAAPKRADAPITLAPFQADDIALKQPTYYFSQTLRSGQSIRFDGNLVVIGDVNNGSEISATGNILVWGELKGIAHAGANGDSSAEIRALKIEAVQLRIGKTIARRPDRVAYHKANNDLPQPEVARIADGEIRIFKDVVGYNN